MNAVWHNGVLGKSFVDMVNKVPVPPLVKSAWVLVLPIGHF
jgi:hypothetical protein